MKNIRWKNKSIALSGLLALAFCAGGGVTALSAGAVELNPHADCNLQNEYCLVCDVANKVNALPLAEEITVENAAEVTQQIHDIDRIKYDLTDDEFEELRALVEVENYGDVVRYDEAVQAVQNVQGGAWFVVTKSFDLGNETLQDTTDTQVSFKVTNVETDVATTLTLFDLGASTSALGAEYYEVTADGWSFGYNLPAGTYFIEEINTEKAIVINGEKRFSKCVSMSDGIQTVAGNGITVTLSQNEQKTVSVLNSVGGMEFVVLDENGNGIEGVVLSTNTIAFEDEIYRTTDANGCFSVRVAYESQDTLTVVSAPDGYCIPDPIEYVLDSSVYSGATDLQGNEIEGFTVMGNGAVYELVLKAHDYGTLIESTSTCTTGGVAAHYQCSKCEKYFTEEKVGVDYEDLQETARGHNYGTRIGGIPASCTMGGLAPHYHCDACGAYFNDEQVEVAYEDLYLDAVGHEYGDWTVTVEPTPNEDGLQERSCSRCRAKQEEVIPATGYTIASEDLTYLLIVVGGVLLLAAISAVFIDTERREL